MSDLTAKAAIQLHVVFQLSESEARALEALVGYGDDAFIGAFYERLGQHYMQPHEKGLRSLFKSVRDQMPGILKRADDARKIFDA